MKILFNHYFPITRQVQLLSELQQLVHACAIGNLQSKQSLLLSDEQIESQVVKPFQFLYPNFYNINHITKIVNLEKYEHIRNEHFKEVTFKPKINPESANIDLQNISQLYAKISQQRQSQGVTAELKPVSQRDDREGTEQDVSDFSEEDEEEPQHNVRKQQKRTRHQSKSNVLEVKKVELAKMITQNQVSSRAHSRQGSEFGAPKAADLQKRQPFKSYSRNGYSPRPLVSRDDQSSIQHKSPTPDKRMRFEYLYHTQQSQQEKLRQQQERKLREETECCTFKPNINQISVQSSKMFETGMRNNDSSRNLPQHVSPAKRFEALYKTDVQKREQKLKDCEEQKLQTERKSLQECTFQPRIVSKSPAEHRQMNQSKTPPKVVGYDDTINRMRAAQIERQRVKEAYDNLGRVKSSMSPFRRVDGTTSTQPFQLSYQNKDKKTLKQLRDHVPQKKNQEDTQDDVLLFMEILVKQGQKVKLKIKKSDDPNEVAGNFARIYGLNQRSQEALAQIITEQLQTQLGLALVVPPAPLSNQRQSDENIAQNQIINQAAVKRGANTTQQKNKSRSRVRQYQSVPSSGIDSNCQNRFNDDYVEEPLISDEEEEEDKRGDDADSSYDYAQRYQQVSARQNAAVGGGYSISSQQSSVMTTSNNQLQRDDSTGQFPLSTLTHSTSNPPTQHQLLDSKNRRNNQIEEAEESREETDVIDDNDDEDDEESRINEEEESNISMQSINGKGAGGMVPRK